MDKIKVLFFNRDKGGVNYFRTETPAIQLRNSYSNDFEVEIKNSIEGKNIDDIVSEFSGYNIIHYHRTLLNNVEINKLLINSLKEKDITLIVDIDDYWVLDKTHPLYSYSIESKLKEISIDNILNADYVTTTTEYFANEIRKYNKNVIVLHNSVNSEIQSQFKDNNKFDRDIVNITYLGGSSHLYDLKELEGAINILNSDKQVKGKFKILLGGFDTVGTTNESVINPEFVKVMKILKLYNNQLLSKLKSTKGDLSKIKELPLEVRDMFKDNVFIHNRRNIKPQESVYYKYEHILTDKYNLINDNREYINYLNKFTKEKYIKESEVNYIRRWTSKPNEYAKILDETDILLAPLVNTTFNNMKSNLKQIEASTRKLPIICSDIIPYNVDGIDNFNTILIKDKRNQGKYWAKALKSLILNKDLRETLGNNLYESFKNKYNLVNVTELRSKLYKSVIHSNELL